MAYLYDTLKDNFGKIAISKVEIPNYISDNLKPGYGEREYQKEAFQRFILFYNEDFEGWGREDSDLVIRLGNKGVLAKRLRYVGIVYHIYHTENPRDQLKENDLIQHKSIQEKIIRTEKGISQYL